MLLPKKTFRYYYWLIIEFTKKNLKLIILSFFLTFVCIITLISISPYIQTFFLTKTTTIGLVGKYDVNNAPEEIAEKISNGLTYVNEKGEIIPALASSWEVSKDKKIYTFHLKNNLLWNNGKKFSAKDLHYSFKDIDTKAISDTAIQFTLKHSLEIFPAFLTKPIIQYPLNGVAGLYKLDRIKYRYGYIKELYLTPNQKDFNAIIYKFFDDEKQLIVAYKLGEITEFTTSKKSQAEIFQNWKNSSVIKSVDYSRLFTLFFNLNNPFLKEKDIRQALVAAINPKLFEEQGELAVGPIPPNSWAYNSKQKKLVYDQEEAAKVFKKAVEGKKQKLIISTYYDFADSAEEISKEYNNVGLSNEVNYLTYNTGANFDLFLTFWKVPNDPDQYYFWHSTQKEGNISNYVNVKVDKLLEDGRNTLNKEERKKLYHDFQKIILDDPPAAFLYYPYIYKIKRK